MTYLQERLLDEAMNLWSRGFRIPTTLYANMAGEGMDVIQLEEIYYKDEAEHGN